MNDLLALLGLAGVAGAVVFKVKNKENKRNRLIFFAVSIISLFIISVGLFYTPGNYEMEDVFESMPLITKEEIESLFEKTKLEASLKDYDVISIAVFKGEEVYLRETLVNQRESEPVKLIDP